jgi:hypothetical protein
MFMLKFLNINFSLKMSSRFTKRILLRDPDPACTYFPSSPHFKTTIN